VKGVTAIEDYAWSIWKKIGYIPSATHSNAVARTWDRRSIDALINRTDYPLSTAAGAYMKSWFGAEYGGPTDLASALTVVLEESSIWGKASEYDERWQVPGGMSMLPNALEARLPSGSITHDQRLVAIRRNADRSYTLTFHTAAGATTTAVADRVVLALPPTMMRRVDCSKADFSTAKTMAIRHEPMGTNSKLALQFSGQPWADNGKSGDAVSDLFKGMAWQESWLATDPSVLVILGQKDYGATAAHGVAPDAVVSSTMTAVDTLWPGSSAKLIAGQCYLDNWRRDPYARGCYPYYGLGGFTTYGGYQRKQEGQVYFAGDSTARYVERSTMCGAGSSGERVARQITNH